MPKDTEITMVDSDGWGSFATNAKVSSPDIQLKQEPATEDTIPHGTDTHDLDTPVDGASTSGQERIEEESEASEKGVERLITYSRSNRPSHSCAIGIIIVVGGLHVESSTVAVDTPVIVGQGGIKAFLCSSLMLEGTTVEVPVSQSVTGASIEETLASSRSRGSPREVVTSLDGAGTSGVSPSKEMAMKVDTTPFLDTHRRISLITSRSKLPL